MIKNKLQILFINSLLVFTLFSRINAADILSGRVYKGETGTEPPISTPLSGVTVKLYASNNVGNLGSQIGSTTTDSQGWYGLTATAGYEFYTIVEVDPSGHHSVGATSVDGTVINNNRIRYSTESAPLSDQTLTGNKFWDKPDVPSNNPPVADANGPYTGKVGQSVTLDGSGSYDPDSGDSIVSYEWDIDKDGQYDDATGVTVQYIWYSVYNGWIGLRVKDSFGESDIDSTSITITEDEQLGNITIIKAATPPDSGVVFNFTGDLGNFTLTLASNLRSFNNLSPGVYTITENVPSEWLLGNYQIAGDLDGGTTHDSLNARFSIDLDAGETISIVIYNYKGGNITIEKQTVPDNSQQIFNFHGSLGAIALSDGYSVTQYNLQPGLYEITEDTLTGWKLTDIIISDENSTANLTNRTASIYLEAGESVSATFINIAEGEAQLDFGDAPDSLANPGYPTLLANNGARHFIKQGFHLGAGIDADSNGHPSMLSDGDDLNPATGPDDEDGITMSQFIAAGQSIPITVVASDTGVLNAWLDFNINGTWADAGEHFISAMPVYPGANSFTLNVPAGVAPGLTYARFRLSTVRQLSYDGVAPDGEVEDYAIEIKEPQDGSIIVIKDATPKDNTQFLICQQLSGSFFNLLCGFLQDPLINKMTILNPGDVISISEAVIPGWSLQDITVIGDIDNGSIINVASGRVDLDHDPGENIVITFKNKKVEDDELFDLGDAPDGTNHSGLPMDAYSGVPAHFPTVFDPATGMPQGPLHIQPRTQAYLGYRVSLENDADIGADEDPTNNIIPKNNRPDLDYHDDCVLLPLLLPDCGITSFDYRVTVAPAATKQNFYVNVWFDWNRDGDWKDKVPCSDMQAPEWAVQNQVITLGPGTHALSTPSFLSAHPAFTGTPPPIWMRIMITTLASNTDDGSGPANGYPFGETEDYYFVPRITGDVHYDFGDAPDNLNAPAYPTLHANGGAYHVATDGFQLGGLIDSEIDGQPTHDAMGDDNIDIDDEDGVTFSTPLVPGQPAVVDVVASAKGVLNAWIDYDSNTSWMDSDEHIFIDVPLNPGNNPLTFNVPVTAVPGSTFARFRLSQIAGLLSTGYGHAGEVEDYKVDIAKGGKGPPLKWQQIPLQNKDTEMPYTPYYMGWDVPSLYDGTFVADDWFCKSPRPVTSIQWLGSYTEWDSAFPPPIAPHAFHLGVWTDVPKDEDTDWSRPGEMIWEWTVPRKLLDEHVQGNDFHPEYMSKPDTCFWYDFIIPKDEWFRQESDSAIYWLSIAALYEEVPDSFVWGWTTREHFFHDDAVYVYDLLTPTVGAVTVKTEPIDEGWDMAFILGTDEYFMEYDFGDAPSERYPTFFDQNGALHIYNPKVYLGQHIDTEINGQSDDLATGDDDTDIDDEDGITFTTPIKAGQTTTVKVTASRSGYLNAWMDFNNNGSWADSGEQIFLDKLISSGQSYLPVSIPEHAVPPPLFSRFRFSTEPGLYFVGLAIDGEVEDYYANYIIVDVEAPQNNGKIPTEFKLMQNFPNPFNPSTTIKYELPKAGHVRIVIYDLLGHRIRTILDTRQKAGHFQTVWDGTDERNVPVTAGVYLCRMEAGDFIKVIKLALVK